MFLAAGAEYGVSLPYAAIAHDRFKAAIAAGDADKDFVVLLERVRHEAGLA